MLKEMPHAHAGIPQIYTDSFPNNVSYESISIESEISNSIRKDSFLRAASALTRKGKHFNLPLSKTFLLVS